MGSQGLTRSSQYIDASTPGRKQQLVREFIADDLTNGKRIRDIGAPDGLALGVSSSHKIDVLRINVRNADAADGLARCLA
jgi:hypothetical protein